MSDRVLVDTNILIIADYRSAWIVFATTPDTVLLAIDGVERHQLSFWDANDLGLRCDQWRAQNLQ